MYFVTHHHGRTDNVTFPWHRVDVHSRASKNERNEVRSPTCYCSHTNSALWSRFRACLMSVDILWKWRLLQTARPRENNDRFYANSQGVTELMITRHMRHTNSTLSLPRGRAVGVGVGCRVHPPASRFLVQASQPQPSVPTTRGWSVPTSLFWEG